MKRQAPPSAFVLSLLLVAAGCLAVRVTEVPPPWFDEGWVLSVARNWVELGHYGQLLDGERIVGNMPSVGLPAIAPVALSFRVFGIGVWQGRLPGIVFTLVALWLLYVLACRIRDCRTAVWTVFASLFMATMPSMSPVIIGRQVLGEMPGLCFMLAGFVCLTRSAERRRLIILVSCFWGLAIATKLLFLPFLVVGIAFAAASLAHRKHWANAALISAALIGALAAYECMAVLEMLLQGPGARLGGTRSTYVATALVFALGVRMTALITAAVTVLLTIVGAFMAFSDFRKRWQIGAEQWEDAISLSLVVLVTSWALWYVLMSYGWPRYLFPAFFVGSIFVGSLMARFSQTTQGDVSIGVGSAKVTAARSSRGTVVFLKFAVVGSVLLSVLNLPIVFVATPPSSIMSVIDYVNSSSPVNALFETYEMELLFLMTRRYHYPPEEVQTQLNRRTFKGELIEINYDPLKADPDYLIVGRHGALWHLYDRVIQAGHFRLVKEYSRYRIYGRVR